MHNESYVKQLGIFLHHTDYHCITFELKNQEFSRIFFLVIFHKKIVYDKKAFRLFSKKKQLKGFLFYAFFRITTMLFLFKVHITLVMFFRV